MTAYSAAVDADGNLEGGSSSAVVPWWSFTKTLIAVSALRLAEEGYLALDARVDGLPYTPRDLLQHRAGVGNYGGLREYHDAIARGDDPWTDEEVFSRIPADKLMFAPKAGFAYSNVGYLVLRRLVEKCYGDGLGEVLRALVLSPLGLTSSRFATTRDDMRATAFAGGLDYHPGWAFHGIVIGPVSEAALALHRLLCGDLLDPGSCAAMRDGVAVGASDLRPPWVSGAYGLGLMAGAMHHSGIGHPVAVVGHSAGGPGSVGAVYHAIDSQRTAACFIAGQDEGAAEVEALKILATPSHSSRE